ncbi:MAG: UvrB/UvrC motif-containing protein [Planctomycetaceae bacterium]|nr:UvrB/UvrC motif-containing protein [Planctomycetaceae bacterium]MCA9045720.1 UvrB/UvrC motif-containing protein [Planctomycetaceae bacterium]MCB9953945.1 UvrB/UvrC motif-containing protein [Planctomycetaceae bacterium]
MKKCLRCNKQANLHITEIKNGKAHPVHLCESCAQEYLNVVDLSGKAESFDFEEEASSSTPDIPEVDPTKACPYCGITHKEFRASGRLGCSHDYEVFREQLIPLLENIHSGEIQHVGKCPPRVSDSSRRHYELLRYRSLLKAAINDENYETAAELRDKIQALEDLEENGG